MEQLDEILQTKLNSKAFYVPEILDFNIGIKKRRRILSNFNFELGDEEDDIGVNVGGQGYL